MKIYTVLLLAFFLVSCETYVGNQQLALQDASTINKQIIKNKTTKNDVLAMFGKPGVKATDENGEIIWGYTATEIMYGQDSKQLIIHFNSRGKVAKYSFIDVD